ncbi:MAG: glycosyltransferase family 2 protein [Clostridiales bacterium]|nr:glycosyltransferase family 2 protein [Clostridiales bacterium]
MNAVVILPSYNPDQKMVDTVNGLIENGFKDIVVVDDGSREDCKKFFREVEKSEHVTLLTHEVNKGKGRAMKTAFSYVYNNKKGISGVVTADGDGQHLPKDVAACVKRMEKASDRIVFGVRNFSDESVPSRSKLGNTLTKFIFRVLLGIKISDTQTGLRAIPFKYLPLMAEIEGERYEYETNQIIEIKRNRIKISEVVIDTVYIDENESSHFHPLKDSARIYKIIFKNVGRRFADKIRKIKK